jgi:hypothetical protein
MQPPDRHVDRVVEMMLDATQHHDTLLTAFDDGNGHSARAIADMSLARSEGSPRSRVSKGT